MIAVLNRVLRHNLRNEMTVVGGYAKTIANRADGEVASLATKIADAAEGLTALSEKARGLDDAMREVVSPEPRDVVADVEQELDELRDEWPDTEFAVEAAEDCLVVATERIRLALRELGENAAKHGESSRVVFRVDWADDGCVTVSVSDSGPGLSESERQVLERGRETPLEHGQGLGLWLVNWVVTGVGGSVNATVDDGTVVTLGLPAVSDGSSDSLSDTYHQAAISTDTR